MHFPRNEQKKIIRSIRRNGPFSVVGLSRSICSMNIESDQKAWKHNTVCDWNWNRDDDIRRQTYPVSRVKNSLSVTFLVSTSLLHIFCHFHISLLRLNFISCSRQSLFFFHSLNGLCPVFCCFSILSERRISLLYGSADVHVHWDIVCTTSIRKWSRVLLFHQTWSSTSSKTNVI